MAPPAAPSNLDGSFNPDDTITLMWTDEAAPPDNEDGYRVFESTDGGSSFTNLSGNLPADTETFTTGPRDRDRGFVYFVEAFNVDGTSQSEETTVIDEGFAVDDETDRFTEEPPTSPPAAVEDGTGGGPIDQETGYLVDEVMDRFTESVPQSPPQAVVDGVGGEAIEPVTGYLADEVTDRFSTWPPPEEDEVMEEPPDPVRLGDGAGGFSAVGAASFGLVPGLATGGKPGTIGAGFRG